MGISSISYFKSNYFSSRGLGGSSKVFCFYSYISFYLDVRMSSLTSFSQNIFISSYSFFFLYTTIFNSSSSIFLALYLSNSSSSLIHLISLLTFSYQSFSSTSDSNNSIYHNNSSYFCLNFVEVPGLQYFSFESSYSMILNCISSSQSLWRLRRYWTSRLCCFSS